MKLALLTPAEPSGDRLELEIVERKGRGHPDTICDSIAEEVSVALSRRYLEACGQVRHYNVDKALLWAGSSAPRFGGGRLTAPMELFVAGRATAEAGGERLDFGEIVAQVASDWLAANIPMLKPADLVTHALIRPTSETLDHLFSKGAGEVPLSNDTSIGTGYAPLSRLERLVLAAEAELSRLAGSGHPEIGPDIKILAVRERDRASLTVACAFIDSHLARLSDYLEAKERVGETVRALAEDHGLAASVEVNAADDPDAGSVYLTVTGTSAEGGDDGQAGRGNRVNGLITPMRAMTIESAAGKNAVSHVGKLYNLAAGLIAERAAGLAGIVEAQCCLVSAIGRPINMPQAASLRLRLSAGCRLDDWRPQIERIIDEELAALQVADRALATRELQIGRWPLRLQPAEPRSMPVGAARPGQNEPSG